MRLNMKGNIVEMQNISKAFPGVLALDKVDFSCIPGEVHAVVGENGAGKSTLMKVLAGVYRQDGGNILLKGKEIAFSSPGEAQRQGVSIIYQEFNLIPELTVAENIFLGREPKKRSGFINSPLLYQRSKELLANLGIDIDLSVRVGELGVAQRQMVEIAKALSLNADILIMDEPSAVVSGKELESLFRIIRALKESGKAIIYISHLIAEIFQIADRATVLKDGELVGTVRIVDVDKSKIVRMMVGRAFSETFPAREHGERKEVLTLNGVSRGSILRNVSFRVYGGEVLGIAGLVGAGRTELARAIFGADPIDHGEILLNGRKLKKITPKSSISNGIGFVTEDRTKDGLVQLLSLRKNLTLTILNKIKKWFFLKEGQEKEFSKKCVDQFGIVAPSIEQEVRYLSGGNQQKVILAKWLGINPGLLIMDEPTRGIDVGAKTEVYRLIRSLAKQGTAIIMISSELHEIIGMSDRIIVMHDGKVMGELSPDKATEERLLMMATGHKVEEATATAEG
jgi:ribose transport system ATP-binding protein